jgi:hypothetical protein
MWLINTKTTDDTETLVCHICREPFPTLEPKARKPRYPKWKPEHAN